MKNANETKLPSKKTNESSKNTSEKEPNANTERNGLKAYFKTLFQIKKKDNGLKQLETQPDKTNDKAKNDSSTTIQESQCNEAIQDENIQVKIVEPEVVEHTDLPHRFLTVKNKDPMFFEDYRKNCIKTSEQFKFFPFYIFSRLKCV